MALIGLDIGTTGCKAIVFRKDGVILGRASREYPVLTPRPDWAEQDAERVWRLALEALRSAIAAARAAAPDDPPAAMALSVQGEAVMPVDARGRPLRAAILGMDARTVAQNAWLAERFGAEALYARTGMPLHTVTPCPSFSGCGATSPNSGRPPTAFSSTRTISWGAWAAGGAPPSATASPHAPRCTTLRRATGRATSSRRAASTPGAWPRWPRPMGAWSVR